MKQKHIIEIEVDYKADRCRGLTGADLVSYVEHQLCASPRLPSRAMNPRHYKVTDVTVWAGLPECLADRPEAVNRPARPGNFCDYPLPLPPVETPRRFVVVSPQSVQQHIPETDPSDTRWRVYTTFNPEDDILTFWRDSSVHPACFAATFKMAGDYVHDQGGRELVCIERCRKAAEA